MKKIIAMLLSVLMVLSLTACGGSAAPTATKAPATATAPAADADPAANDATWGLSPFAEPQKLRIGFFTGSPLSYPYLFAENLGVFDALNIDVEFVCFTGGPAMMEAGNDWDICSLGLGGVSIGLSAYDYILYDVNDYEENLAIFVRPDSDLANDPANPELWKGAECVYPTGTTAQAVLAAYLQTMGLSLSDVVSTNADNSNALTVFSGGTGDVLGCWNAIALSAEDAGFVRVSDSGQLDIGMMCGSFVHPAFLAANPELVATASAVFHLAAEWSAEHLDEASTMYYDHCEEEGFLCTEEVAAKTMNWYRGPSVDQYIEKFTTEEDGHLAIENDILLGYDFFVSEGKYTAEQRDAWLNAHRVDNSVALAVKELLGR